jgi:hypothetical protein
MKDETVPSMLLMDDLYLEQVDEIAKQLRCTLLAITLHDRQTRSMLGSLINNKFPITNRYCYPIKELESCIYLMRHVTIESQKLYEEYMEMINKRTIKTEAIKF